MATLLVLTACLSSAFKVYSELTLTANGRPQLISRLSKFTAYSMALSRSVYHFAMCILQNNCKIFAEMYAISILYVCVCVYICAVVRIALFIENMLEVKNLNATEIKFLFTIYSLRSEPLQCLCSFSTTKSIYAQQRAWQRCANCLSFAWAEIIFAFTYTHAYVELRMCSGDWV